MDMFVFSKATLYKVLPPQFIRRLCKILYKSCNNAFCYHHI